MVNSADFSNRIKKLMQMYELTASTFADKIGVQRSSISHILSGRNKPSLDFVMKITENFDNVDINWLLYGKNDEPKKKETIVASPSLNQPKKEVASPLSDLFQEKEAEKIEHTANRNQKKIQRIVVFYVDGTFDAYEN
ncbi:helix-turn-helix domain-containing protein [Polaribacter sp.]|nr:helix-turn-helix domain-containing protein [Polaribacter sp.]